MIQEIMKVANLTDFIVKPKRAGSQELRVTDFLEAILNSNTGAEAAALLNIAPQTFKRLIKKIFPNVNLAGGRETWKYFLLDSINKKKCPSCLNIRDHSAFGKASCNIRGLNYLCRLCEASKSSVKRAKMLNRMPKWADVNSITLFYINCPHGHHVDHVIPLQGENVSGLHVIENLQYLLARDNLIKSNKFKVG